MTEIIIFKSSIFFIFWGQPNKSFIFIDILGKKKISIKRIYSWLGYFWYELYKDCLNYNPIRFCKNCGTLVASGRQDKIYCTKKENPNCWKERSALRTKKNYYKHQ